MSHLLSDRIAAASQLVGDLEGICTRAIATEMAGPDSQVEVAISFDRIDVAIFFTSRSVLRLVREILEAEMTEIIRNALGSYLPQGTDVSEAIEVNFYNIFREEDEMDLDTASGAEVVIPPVLPRSTP